MKNISEVSIILPNYNSHLYLKKTLDSILRQSFKNWKLFIVDDNSKIKTKEILVKYKKNKKIKIFFLKKNKGTAYCRNLALKKAKTKYIAFIDSDDIWKKNKLKKQIAFMKKNSYDFTYTNYETFGMRKDIILVPAKFNFSKFINNTSIGTSTMIIKRSIIKNAKFLNTSSCDDYYFKCKVLQNTRYAYRLNQCLTRYRIRKNSVQGSNLRNVFWIWKINKNYNKFNFIRNLTSIFSISINSLKKYKGKNLL